MASEASNIAQEVVQHLVSQLGAEAEVTLEISVRIPQGTPEEVVRIVTENCRTLHFRSYEFEDV